MAPEGIGPCGDAGTRPGGGRCERIVTGIHVQHRDILGQPRTLTTADPTGQNVYGRPAMTNTPSHPTLLPSSLAHHAASDDDAAMALRMLVGRGMPEKLTWAMRMFSKRALGHITYPEDDAMRVRDLGEKGLVVYVHRARNLADHLSLTHCAQKHGLPYARFVGGLNVRWLRPWFGLFRSPLVPKSVPKQATAREEWYLEQCIRGGHPAELFLRRPLTLVQGQAQYPARYVDMLIRLQRELDKPIFLVPHFLALRTTAMHFEPTAIDVMFGTTGEPGTMKALTRALLAEQNARWLVGDALNLQELLDNNEGTEDAVLAKKARWQMLDHLTRLERTYHGPPIKAPARMRAEALRDVKLQQHIQTLSDETGVPKDKLTQKAGRQYDEIAAKFNLDFSKVVDKLLRRVWNRIYDGLVWNDQDIERIRKYGRRGPLIIVPSHRSHVDYLVMSQVMFWNGLMPPHIAAGVNLSFFPMGYIFRRGGAFFIRRSFKGDPLYPQVFRTYVKKLFKEGFTQEFFIEGGRSRTGKTLPPKMGFLGMVVEAFMEGKQDDAIFVPASIAYEKLIEQNSYTRELKGAKKRKEDAGALLRSAGVLRHRYGRVHVNFDEGISLNDFLVAELGEDWRERDITKDERRHLIASLAHKIVYGINRAQVVTPTSLAITALLGHRDRGLPESVMLATARRLMVQIREVAGEHARFAPGLEDDAEGQIVRALKLLVKDGLLTIAEVDGDRYYRIVEDGFLPLDYYKNNIIHHFVAESMLACAAVSLGHPLDGPLSKAEVAERTKLFSRLFKFEFIFEVGKTFDVLFDETLERLTASGIIGPGPTPEERVISARAHEQKQVHFAVHMMLNFVETYAIVFDRLEAILGPDGVAKKALSDKLLDALKAAFLKGDLSCPEGVSKALADNAVRVAMDRGVLVVEDGHVTFDKAAFDEKLAPMQGALEAVLTYQRGR